MTLSHRILEKKRKLEQEKATIQNYLEKFPEGSLLCHKSPYGIKWFQKLSDTNSGRNGNRIYISKKNREFAEKLALKKYYEYKLNETEQELKALNAYLKYHRDGPEESSTKIINSVGFQELLQPILSTFPEKAKQWMDEKYEQNPFHSEQRNVKTIAGIKVRSKSEAFIVLKFVEYGIPFRYEAALRLDDKVYYPDFTIRHRETGKIIYWEHFGLMDSPSYRSKAFEKMETYIKNGIFPMQNLLMTYESGENPLDIEWVDALIQYFLT